VTGDTPSPETASGAAKDRDVAEFAARCDAVEEAYEFMLAYAAQGLPGEEGSQSGGQIRLFLHKCDAALAGLPGVLARCATPSAAAHRAFIDVVEADVRRARAAVQLVLAQPSIGSQLVDNLNASIHLRTVLTDLFLLDDVLKADGRPDPR
jgi:hypothetical protein